MLETRPEYIAEFPHALRVPENTQQTIIVNNLRTSTIEIARDSELTIIAVLTKGWEEVQKLNFHLQGSSSRINFIAVVIGQQKDTFAFETISNHEVPHTQGYYYIRSAMFDESHVDYRGNLVINPAAQSTDSYLAHHTLLLSEKAKADTEPCLEIEADDVKAGHAATVGQIDEELLFYLQSRGIKKDIAKDILIKAFIETDLAHIANEELRALIAQEAEKSLKNYVKVYA